MCHFKSEKEILSVIKNYRKTANLTQSDMAQKLCFGHLNIYNRIETGVSRLNFDILKKITEILNIPAKELLAQVEEADFDLSNLKPSGVKNFKVESDTKVILDFPDGRKLTIN